MLSHFDPRGQGHIDESPWLSDFAVTRPRRRERRRGLLSRLDRDFLRRLMELTLPYLRAISARALYAMRQSTSANPASAKGAPPQPFQRVPPHRRVIEKNVEGKRQRDNQESVSEP